MSPKINFRKHKCKIILHNAYTILATTISYQNCPLEHATELKDIPLTEVKTLADSGISLTAPEEQNEGIIFKPLLPKEDRPVGRASCFIRNEGILLYVYSFNILYHITHTYFSW